MKIIHILAGKANPNTLNGVNKVVHTIAEEQHRVGCDVEVFGVVHNSIRTHDPNYKIKLFRKSKVSFLPPFELLKKLMVMDREVIIHLHSAFIWWFLPLALFLKALKVKFVITPHGAYGKMNLVSSPKKLVYFKTVERFILMCAFRIHILGASEINRFTRRICEDKAVYIFNGTNIRKNDVRVSNKNLTVTFMGRLKVDHKGLDLLLEGFSIFIKKGGQGTLKLVGEGPDEFCIRELVNSLRLNESVKFLGPKFGAEKFEILSSSDFFVHSSRWEGFPTSCLEALSVGTPLLVSRETNLGELVEKRNLGFVLNANTATEIAKSFEILARCKKKSAYEDLVQNSSAIVRDELNWNAINKKLMEELYE